MTQKKTEALPTSKGLPRRLKNLDDSRSWSEFYKTYRPLIYGVATKEGCTDAEAGDVVQETFRSIAQHIKDFEYDPSGSFKAWILKVTRWRAKDQIRKRLPLAASKPHESDKTTRTTTIDKVPNPSKYGVTALWEKEARDDIQKVALEKIRNKVSAKHYQIFDAYAIKGWPAAEVAAALKESEANIFKVKSRVVKLLKTEVSRLEKCLP